MCYTAILYHKLVLLVLVRLIAIKYFNRGQLKILIAGLIAIKIFNRTAVLKVMFVS